MISDIKWIPGNTDPSDAARAGCSKAVEICRLCWNTSWSALTETIDVPSEIELKRDARPESGFLAS